MAYFGKVKPVETTGSVFRSTYTGDGSTTTYNLPVSVANEESIIATINGVTQQDSAYSTNGSQIIFSTAPALNDSIELRCISGVGLSYAPADGSVTTSKLADGTITAGKLASTLDLSGKTVTYGLTGSDMPAGSVLQVVAMTTTTQTSTTSISTYSNTAMTANITPSSSSNKILIFYSAPIRKNSGNSATGAQLRIARDSSTYFGQQRYVGWNNNSSMYGQETASLYYLDSPSTTSQVNYTIQIASSVDGQNVNVGHDNSEQSLLLMEIAG